MSVHEYDIPNHAVCRFISNLDDESYFLDTSFSTSEPSSLDDRVDLDTAEAALLAEADALVGAWCEVCQSIANLPDSEAARQTLRECLEVMSMAIDTDGGTDPAPAIALERAA